MLKKLLLLIFFLVGGAYLERFCHEKTDGFALVNIAPPQSSFFKKISTLPPKNVEPILNQRFKYLTCGSQCYVFISEDQKYVLKFFKFQHMRLPPWTEHLPLPKKLREMRSAKRAKKDQVLHFTLESCQIAAERLAEETGLIYAHLKNTEGLGEVTIIDKIGIAHHILLDRTPFILQKRASSVYETLSSWLKEGDMPKVRNGVDKLFHLILTRQERGISDKDPDFQTNFGFVGDEPIQIDTGRFSYAVKKDPTELYRITRAFETWIRETHPDLLLFFSQEIASLSEEAAPL